MLSPFRVVCSTKPLVLAGCLFLAAAPASAGVISGSSSAYGLSANADVRLLNAVVIDVDAGPLPLRSGTAPTPYSVNGSLAEAHATGALGIPLLGLTDIIDVDTGLLQVAASSNIDGGFGSRTASASASVNNTSAKIFNVSTLLALTNLVRLDATLIGSNASVTGDFGALTPTGSTTIAGVHGLSSNQARLVVLGTEFLIDAAPAANTRITIDSSLGGSLGSLVGSIDLFLNEQKVVGDGSASQSISVNALRLSFNGLAVGLGGVTKGLLNGDIIISHSEAAMQASVASAPAVPEPASLSLLSLGMLSLGALRWRNRLSNSAMTVA